MFKHSRGGRKGLAVLKRDVSSPSLNSSPLKTPYSKIGVSLKANTEEISSKPAIKSALLPNRQSSRRLKTMKTNVIVSNSPAPKNKSEFCYNSHLVQTFKSMKFLRTLPTVYPTYLKNKSLDLPKRPGFEGKKTLILDLDETLVHCVDEPFKASTISLPIQLDSGIVSKVRFNIRPYLQECLREVSQLFEVVVYTASEKTYADPVLNYLDPYQQLIHHRLYRENCITVQGVYMKDLRILRGRELKDMVIVDNNAFCFGLQLDNGIPIISWYDDPNDKELLNLMGYLRGLAQVDDVREINRQTFRLHTFYDDYAQHFRHFSF